MRRDIILASSGATVSCKRVQSVGVHRTFEVTIIPHLQRIVDFSLCFVCSELTPPRILQPLANSSASY